MRQYKCLTHNEYHLDDFSLVPIRDEDKFQIMQWRNEQIYHLRQDKPLTAQDQENYFTNIVAKLFEQDRPGQVLFSFLQNGECIGYGGLVHINWKDKNAEVSFITNGVKEQEAVHWTTFFKLIDQPAFHDMDLHKIFAYAYDVRPHLYEYLLKSQYTLEARLKEHYLLDNVFFDVVIHSKFNASV